MTSNEQYTRVLNNIRRKIQNDQYHADGLVTRWIELSTLNSLIKMLEKTTSEVKDA